MGKLKTTWNYLRCYTTGIIKQEGTSQTAPQSCTARNITSRNTLGSTRTYTLRATNRTLLLVSCTIMDITLLINFGYGIWKISNFEQIIILNCVFRCLHIVLWTWHFANFRKSLLTLPWERMQFASNNLPEQILS